MVALVVSCSGQGPDLALDQRQGGGHASALFGRVRREGRKVRPEARQGLCWQGDLHRVLAVGAVAHGQSLVPAQGGHEPARRGRRGCFFHEAYLRADGKDDQVDVGSPFLRLARHAVSHSQATVFEPERADFDRSIGNASSSRFIHSR